MFDKLKNMIGFNDNYDYDDYEDEDEVKTKKEEDFSSNSKTYDQTVSETYSTDSISTSSFGSNVVEMSKKRASKMTISIQEPTELNDAIKVIDDIRNNKVVVLNIEVAENNEKRKIFDFVSGGTYALKAKIEKVTKGIFVICPDGVEIDGKISDQIQSGFMYQL